VVLLAGSKVSGSPSAASSSSRCRATIGATRAASGVGISAPGARTNSGSSNASRRRASALLVAGWLNER